MASPNSSESDAKAFSLKSRRPEFVIALTLGERFAPIGRTSSKAHDIDSVRLLVAGEELTAPHLILAIRYAFNVWWWLIVANFTIGILLEVAAETIGGARVPLHVLALFFTALGLGSIAVTSVLKLRLELFSRKGSDPRRSTYRGTIRRAQIPKQYDFWIGVLVAAAAFVAAVPVALGS